MLIFSFILSIVGIWSSATFYNSLANPAYAFNTSVFDLNEKFLDVVARIDAIDPSYGVGVDP